MEQNENQFTTLVKKGRKAKEGEVRHWKEGSFIKRGKEWYPVDKDPGPSNPTEQSTSSKDHVSDLMDPSKTPQQRSEELANSGVTDRQQNIALSGNTDVRGVEKAISSADSVEDEDLEESLEDTIRELMEADGIEWEEEEYVSEVTGKDSKDTIQDKFTDLIAKKQRKLAMFYGSGGVGKTYGVKKVFEDPKTLDENGNEFGNELVAYDSELNPSSDEYDYIKFTGKITPQKLFKTLYLHNDKVILFDDCDSILQDEDAVNMLKAATDTTLEDVVYEGSVIKVNDEPIPSRFKFRGSCVIISNLTEEKLREKAQPLLESRGLSLDISRTMEETIDKLERIKYKLSLEDTNGEPIDIEDEHKDVAVDFIKKYQNHMPVAMVNARTMGSLALLHKQSSGNVKSFMNSARQLMKLMPNDIKKFHEKRLREEGKIKKERAQLNSLFSKIKK